jgi:hypothetical protein
MKLIPVLVLLLFVPVIHAQELDRRPDAPKTNDLTNAVPQIPLTQPLLYPNTPIPDGMVWEPRGKVWHAEELNSCAWCGKPMTFKNAAFDKKMSFVFLFETALTVADVELGQSCLKTGRCREGNPLLGAGGRSRQYSIRLPIVAAMWANSAWARKGDKRLHIGGLRLWYIAPLIMHAEAIIGISSGIRHQ